MITATEKKLLVVLAAFLALVGLQRCNAKKDKQIASPILSATEHEKIIVEPRRHLITVVKQDGTETMSLPGMRPVSIVQDSAGQLTVETRKWGTEFQPWLGFGFSDQFGASLGVSLFYWNRLDLNAGVTFLPRDRSLRGIVGPSYNLFSNTFLLAAVDTERKFWAQLFWRF